jgi:hypothetical protein
VSPGPRRARYRSLGGSAGPSRAALVPMAPRLRSCLWIKQKSGACGAACGPFAVRSCALEPICNTPTAQSYTKQVQPYCGTLRSRGAIAMQQQLRSPAMGRATAPLRSLRPLPGRRCVRAQSDSGELRRGLQGCARWPAPRIVRASSVPGLTARRPACVSGSVRAGKIWGAEQENAAQVRRLISRDRKEFLGNQGDILDKFEVELGAGRAAAEAEAASSSKNGPAIGASESAACHALCTALRREQPAHFHMQRLYLSRCILHGASLELQLRPPARRHAQPVWQCLEQRQPIRVSTSCLALCQQLTSYQPVQG